MCKLHHGQTFSMTFCSRVSGFVPEFVWFKAFLTLHFSTLRSYPAQKETRHFSTSCFCPAMMRKPSLLNVMFYPLCFHPALMLWNENNRHFSTSCFLLSSDGALQTFTLHLNPFNFQSHVPVLLFFKVLSDFDFLFFFFILRWCCVKIPAVL